MEANLVPASIVDADISDLQTGMANAMERIDKTIFRTSPSKNILHFKRDNDATSCNVSEDDMSRTYPLSIAKTGRHVVYLLHCLLVGIK